MQKPKLIFLAISLLLFSIPIFSFASATDGTIDAVNKYAEGLESNVGSINFGLSAGNVHVTDSALSGYAWGEVVGWINLAPSFGGVTNNAEGTLGGYAWGEATGWINFTPAQGGVTINSSGDFQGYAWSQNFGWIIFNCATNNSCSTLDFKVSTDWRPASARAVADPPVDTNAGDSPSVPPTPPSEPPPPAPPEEETPTPPENPVPEVEPVTPPESGGEVVESPESSSSGSNGNSQGGGTSSFVETFISPVFTPILNTLNSAKEQVKVSYAVAEHAVKEGYTDVKRVVESPVGSATTKTISTVGAITGGVMSASPILFGSFSEFGLIFLRLWTIILTYFGLRRRSRPWGTVYDSVTKQPLDPALVSVLNSAGKEVTDSITDLDGRFGFLLLPGAYTIKAGKTNYLFPSRKLSGKLHDELYNNLYFGDIITTNTSGEVIIKNIPLDPLNFDWNEFTKRKKHLMRFYSKWDLFIEHVTEYLFILGFVIAVVAFIVAPELYNSITIGIYILLAFLRYIGLKPKANGVIKDRNGIPLSFAIVRIYSLNLGRELFNRVTDRLGRYYALVPPGDYYLTVEEKNPDESYSLVYKGAPFTAKKGIINSNIQI